MGIGSGLSYDVEAIAEALARWGRGPGNNLKWTETAKFKADLANSPARWRHVSVLGFEAKLRAEGVTHGDVAELVAWLRRAQAGREITPHISFRSFRFALCSAVEADLPR